MVRILAWRDKGVETAQLAELPALLESCTPTWVDITGPDDDEARLMRETLGLHPLAIEDTRNQRQRPKLEEYPDHLFLILNPMTVSEGEVDVRELDVFVTRACVVTVHPTVEPAIGEVEARLERISRGQVTPAHLLYVLLDTVVDTYFPILDEIADEIEQLEDLVLERPDHDALNRLFALKRRLVLVRKVVAPQRDVLTMLSHRDLPYLDLSKLSLHLRDVLDHLLRIADMVDTFRDLLSSGIDLYMSAVSNRLNRVVNRLTMVTVVVGTLGLVTGFYGMNFARTWPPFGAAWGVPFTLLVMAALVATVVAVLRRTLDT
jgi:magnesium transporter